MRLFPGCQSQASTTPSCAFHDNYLFPGRVGTKTRVFSQQYKIESFSGLQTKPYIGFEP